VSTRIAQLKPGDDPADRVALVVEAHRARLLRVHSRRLRREDLEECYGQTALELVLRARQGAPFMSSLHVVKVLEQRLLSRIQDRRRALEGRSPAQATLDHALADGLFDGAGEEVADGRIDLHELVGLRIELQRIGSLLQRLTLDQRLVLASQIYLQVDCAEFCARHDWSPEKYRKVAQRARARLRELLSEGA
jgi:DNA-directed RNA polymerase specialized sigma24 family protein